MADAVETDVVVVGSGLAAAMTALTIADEQPTTSVDLLLNDPSRLDTHDGAIDVLGYPVTDESHDGLPEITVTRTESPVRTPFDHFDSLPSEHPYRTIGEAGVRDGLALFDERVPGYRGGHTAQNALTITPGGRLRPVARYPAAVADGLASERRPLLLVGFDDVPEVPVELIGDALSEQVEFAIETTTLEQPLPISSYPAQEELARAFDENVEVAGGTPIRTWLADQIADELDIEPRIGFPAVLGIATHETVRQELESTLQARVFEIPTGPPNLLGRRLQRQLTAALEAAGVTVRESPVTAVHTGESSVEAVETATGRIDATAFVLATGGIEAGGLEATQSAVREPCFDCPVAAPEERAAWVATDPQAAQPFVSFGVPVDDSHRPVRESGDPVYENLYAAGLVRTQVNHVLEQSGGGLAIATGYAAGRAIQETQL